MSDFAAHRPKGLSCRDETVQVSPPTIVPSKDRNDGIVAAGGKKRRIDDEPNEVLKAKQKLLLIIYHSRVSTFVGSRSFSKYSPIIQFEHP